MDSLVTLGILVVAFLGLVVPGLAIAGFARTGRLKAEIASLGARIAQLEAARGPAPTRPEAGAASAAASAETGMAAGVAAAAGTAGDAAAAGTALPPAAAGAASAGSQLDRFERQVTSRWFVWLGAATLGLAAVFLVREAAERGWLGPGVRVTLGFLGGVVLIMAGEAIRRRFPVEPERGRTDYVPPALSAGGFLSCYASLYAAGQLFGFLTPAATFAGMAGVVYAAGLVAMLHGPLLAVLGAAGGLLLPALIATDPPNGWVLFLYLLTLIWGALELRRRRDWPWLGWIALAGGTAWSLAWLVMPRANAPTDPLGLFLVASVLAFTHSLPQRAAALPADAGNGQQGWHDPWTLAWVAGIVLAALTFALARVDNYGPVGLGGLAAVGAALAVAARRFARLDGLAAVAAATTVAALALWHLPAILKPQVPVVYEHGLASPGWAPHLPPQAAGFLNACLFFGGAYGLAGFAALWGAGRPALWAAVSVATPLLLMAAAYWRVAALATDLFWSAAALGLAGLFLAAAARAGSRREAPGMAGVLGIYAGAVTAAISLALAMALRDAWLSVALALELPALAWIYRRLPIEALRAIAGIVAVVLCARLAFNPDVFHYARATAVGDHWPVYGYGVPLAATYLAWRDFARRPAEWLDAWLRALVFAFAALLAAFELRTALLRAEPLTAFAASREAMGAIGWLALATGLEDPAGRGARAVSWVRRALFAAAALAVVTFPLVLRNPAWRADLPVGEWPIVNALLLAYLAPAGLMLAFARQMRTVETRAVVLAAAGLALALGFAWVTLETRHAFRGSNLAAGATSDAESYAYSAVWLAYAGVLLAGGLWQKNQALRIGSLVVVMAAVLKVFLVDMDHLTGLWRVASFFGLGLALVGIGFLYQRLVFVRTEARAVTPS